MMLLPELEYYSLKQLAEHWETSTERISHYIETAKLRCVYYLDHSMVEFGKLKLSQTGCELFEPLSMGWYRGWVTIPSRDARLLFRCGKIHSNQFISLEDNLYHLRLMDGACAKIHREDVVVLVTDIEAFESYYLKATQKQSDESLLMTVENDFQILRLADRRIQLGAIQSRIMKQLYEASLTDNPWVYGKELLYQAGSQTMQLKNIFRRKPQWRDWIESDARGYYRLKQAIVISTSPV